MNERDRDVARKRKSRSPGKDVRIPACKDLRLRKRLELNTEKWLRYYFSDIFTYEFTPQQQEMVSAIRSAIEIGGDQAIAASRGEGKTTLAECVLIYCVLLGVVKFAVLFAATGEDAKNSLEAIKERLAGNERLLEMYPEVCKPILALENTPNRAHYQTVSGKTDDSKSFSRHHSKFSWCGREIKMPNVPGSKCAGSIIATRGLDSAVRGLKIGNRRPDLAVIDDPDTIDTAASDEQAKKLEAKIDKAIAGLGGQQRRIARVMLTTLQNRTCVSYRFTDPQQKPSWHPKRFKFLIKKPDRMDLWEEFVERQKADWDTGTTIAHDLYANNKSAMDCGAIVANPNRFVPGELSAIEHYFVWAAKIGQNAVSTEFDNDPPEGDELNPDQITSNLVGKRISGLEHREVPADCLKITSFVDIGDRNFNWTDTAWADGCIGSILDYGLSDVKSGEFNKDTKKRDPKTLELAVISALHEWRTQLLGKYQRDGQSLPIDLALVDSGSGTHTKAVYKFCREVGAPFFPSKGQGDHWKPPALSETCHRRGNHWAIVKQKDGIRLFEFQSTFWKKFCHGRFITDTWGTEHVRAIGSLAMFICPEQQQFVTDRHEFTHQIVGEVWGVKRFGAKPCWMPTRFKNHFLDATAGTCLAADIVGITLVGDSKPKPKALSLAEMAAAAKR